MKLGFTTLGCPAWSYATVVARARELCRYLAQLG